jgi:hypothetical protein
MANAGQSGNVCTSSSDAQDAKNVAVTYGNNNGVSIPPADIAVNTDTSATTTSMAGQTVTVPAQSVRALVPETAPSFFASVVGISSRSVSAAAIATWNGISTSPYSLFAGNSTCGAGLGISMTSNGGGKEDITGIHSNGSFVWAADSNHPVYGTYSSDQTGNTPCANNSWNSKQNGNITSSGTAAIPYPETYIQPGTPNGPTCTYSSTYFSTSATGTHAISGAGVYCVTTTTAASCDGSDSKASGTIYVGTALSGSYEFVGPCISLNTSGTISAPANSPLIYGTTSSPVGANPPTDIYIEGNGATINAPIYDPSGTVEITGNNGAIFTGFIEADNITVDKNSFATFTGNGPSATSGGDDQVGEHPDDAGPDGHLGVESPGAERERCAAEMRGRLAGRDVEHVDRQAHADHPAGRQRPPVIPAGVQAKDERRQNLDDNDPADELEFDSER